MARRAPASERRVRGTERRNASSDLLARVLSKDERERQADEHGKWLKDPSVVEVAAALAKLKERIPKAALPAIYRDDDTGRSSEKHVWSLPTSTCVLVLVYRKDLFLEAGLHRPPRTWDEVLEYSKKLTIPSRKQYGMGLMTGGSAGWMAFSFMASNGAKTVEQDADGKWRVSYGSHKSAEAVYYLWRLLHEKFEAEGKPQKGSTLTGWEDIPILYQQGKIGMRLDYLDDNVLADLNPQRDGFAPFPGPVAGMSGGELNCTMLSVYSGVSPAEKIGAMRLIWYLTSDEAAALRTKIMVENGRMVGTQGTGQLIPRKIDSAMLTRPRL